jgi:hypothetical protein
MEKRWHGEESRWGDRVRVNIPVQVSANALTGAEGCMKNLSLSGALVKADVLSIAAKLDELAGDAMLAGRVSHLPKLGPLSSS